jgi:hypothetical protein
MRRSPGGSPRGWLPVAQALVFPAPTFVGDAVAADASPLGPALCFETRIRNQHGATTVGGEARVTDALGGYPVRSIDDSFAHGDLESDAELLGLTLGQSATPPPNGSPSATWTTPST